MSQHNKTLRHLENAYEYYVEEKFEENFEKYFVNVTVI
jgi:hypothetical protein